MQTVKIQPNIIKHLNLRGSYVAMRNISPCMATLSRGGGMIAGLASMAAARTNAHKATDAIKTSGFSYSFSADKLKFKETPSGRPPVVLVSCGSFNPPTKMHLGMFDVATRELEHLGYDVWGGYMSPVSDLYGKKDLAQGAHRVAMCQIATSTSPHVMVDDWEMRQPGYTRTLLVLKHVAQEFEKMLSGVSGDMLKMRPQVMLLCGADVLESMARPGVWENLEALFTEHGVVAVARPGSDDEKLLKHPHLQPYLPYLKIVKDFEHSDISSSKVRSTWRAGGSVASSLSEGVENFMKQEQLYPKPV